jgi:Ca2+-binding EF-hand superfamily protein
VDKEEIKAVMERTQRWRGRAGEAMFRRMDANRDGRLTKDEWKLKAEFFERFDRNKDGFISADEVMLLGRGGRGRRGPDARSGKSSAHFLQKYDANRDGKVTKDEFKHERRFAEIDADGDGALSKAEIEEAMDKRMRESDLGFFERFDLNGDGKVTRAEFTGPASSFEAKDRNNDGIIDASDKPDRK